MLCSRLELYMICLTLDFIVFKCRAATEVMVVARVRVMM